jgi:hypothetical protein
LYLLYCKSYLKIVCEFVCEKCVWKVCVKSVCEKCVWKVCKHDKCVCVGKMCERVSVCVHVKCACVVCMWNTHAYMQFSHTHAHMHTHFTHTCSYTHTYTHSWMSDTKLIEPYKISKTQNFHTTNPIFYSITFRTHPCSGVMVSRQQNHTTRHRL